MQNCRHRRGMLFPSYRCKLSLGRCAVVHSHPFMKISCFREKNEGLFIIVVTGYSSSQHASPLLELMCHMGSHSVTCHPAEVTFQPLPQPKLILDLATPEGCKAELTLLAGYTPWWYTRPKTVTHPSTNRAQCTVTSFMRRDERRYPLHQAASHTTAITLCVNVLRFGQ